MKRKNYAAWTAAFLAVAILSFYAGRYSLFKTSKLLTVTNTIRKHYALEYDEKDAEDKAAYAYVESLGDPYSVYFSKGDFDMFTDEINYNYRGIGVVIDFSSDDAVIDLVAEDSPAKEAGLAVGDVLLSVDGRALTHENYSDVTSYIRGYAKDSVPDDTAMKFEIRRGDETLYFDIKRESVHYEPVDYTVTDDGILYLSLAVFSSESAADLHDVISQVEGNISGVILDLRDNNGGDVRALLSIAGEFMPEGLLFSSVDANGKNKEYKIRDNDYIAVPMAVLVNENSASASEILSSAIKESGRGVLIGTQTFGKGLVQSIMRFDDGSALKYTEAEYYTYGGTDINGVGVEPDIYIEDADEQYNEAFNYLRDKI